MKSRASLVLMEQLVMILVFALAAALCLGVFIKADGISQNIAYRDEAILIAQNAAEVLKATDGDVQRASAVLSPEAARNGYTLEVEPVDSGSDLMGMAEIRVYLKEELLFTLRTGWQEGLS